MSDTNKDTVVKMFEPSHSLDDKVTVVDDSKKEEAVKKAEKFMESLEDDFEKQLSADMQKLKNAWQDMLEAPQNQQFSYAKKLFEIVLNIKGESGSFGFPIISDIGDSLCCFIDELTKINAKDVEIIKLHIEAMNLAIAKNIKTKENSADNEELVAGLLQIAKNRINSLKEEANQIA